jgi:hypothetical protein
MLPSARALRKLCFAERCGSWARPIKFVPAGSFGRCTRSPRTTCLHPITAVGGWFSQSHKAVVLATS